MVADWDLPILLVGNSPNFNSLPNVNVLFTIYTEIRNFILAHQIIWKVAKRHLFFLSVPLFRNIPTIYQASLG